MLNQTLKSVWLAAVVCTIAVLPATVRGEAGMLPAPSLPSVEVVIDVGHGGIDGGTSHKDLLEKDINLQISKQLLQELNQRGIRAISNRAGDYALSDDNRWLRSSRHKRDLAQRSELANQLNPWLMVSLHCNWSPNKGKRGPLVIYQKDGKSLTAAKILQSSLNRLYGTKTAVEKGKTYYVLNHTRCPTVIVEMGFLSNDGDRSLLTSPSGQSRIASALADGIAEYLHLGRLY